MVVKLQTADGKISDNPDYKLVILHDRNDETLAFNPSVAEKTCGKCHQGIVSGFLKSSMGGGKGAHTQSQYRIWTGKTEPQSCGLWVGALSGPSQDRFTDENIRLFNLHSTMPLSEKTALNVQRTCNQCHVEMEVLVLTNILQNVDENGNQEYKTKNVITWNVHYT